MDARTHPTSVADIDCRHQLRFAWLHDPGHGIAFPCDGNGNVDINALTEPRRTIYLGAWAMVGHYYARPTIQIVNAPGRG
jgi:hypothetical protein